MIFESMAANAKKFNIMKVKLLKSLLLIITLIAGLTFYIDWKNYINV